MLLNVFHVWNHLNVVSILVEEFLGELIVLVGCRDIVKKLGNVDLRMLFSGPLVLLHIKLLGLENPVKSVLLVRLEVDLLRVLVDVEVNLSQELFDSVSELVFEPLANLVEAKVDSEHIVG